MQTGGWGGSGGSGEDEDEDTYVDEDEEEDYDDEGINDNVCKLRSEVKGRCRAAHSKWTFSVSAQNSHK